LFLNSSLLSVSDCFYIVSKWIVYLLDKIHSGILHHISPHLTTNYFPIIVNGAL